MRALGCGSRNYGFVITNWLRSRGRWRPFHEIQAPIALLYSETSGAVSFLRQASSAFPLRVIENVDVVAFVRDRRRKTRDPHRRGEELSNFLRIDP